MSPKRGQPPKSQEEKRLAKLTLRYNERELFLLEKAYGALPTPKKPFLRWLANITLEEAKRIIESKKN